MCRFVTVYRHRPLPDCARLFLVDFAYPAEQLVQLRESVAHITVLDHHKSAQAALANIREQPPRFETDQAPPGLFALFDMGESGATLAWQYFHPETDCPELLRYIKDRDLWQHALPGSRAINAAIRSYPYDFTVWAEKLAAADATAQLLADGEAILRKQAHDMEGTDGRSDVDGAGWLPGPRRQCYREHLRVGSSAMRRCFPRRRSVPAIGIRPRIDGSGVSARWETSMSVQLPRRYGGGGHRNAAGFQTARPPLLAEADRLLRIGNPVPPRPTGQPQGVAPTEAGVLGSVFCAIVAGLEQRWETPGISIHHGRAESQNPQQHAGRGAGRVGWSARAGLALP